MITGHQKYYDQPSLWNNHYSKEKAEDERINKIITLLPTDIKSILDVGCGNGLFLNALANSFPDKFKRLVGIDISKEALKYVQTEKVRGTITQLPFPDNSFDAVTALEVLEHLTYEDLLKAISELTRVSKQYLIISVPNDQNLKTSLVMCPQCYTWFNPDYHTRSFNHRSLEDLFYGYKLIALKEIGPLVLYRNYNSLLLVYYYIWKTPKPPEHAICPLCGYKQKKEEGESVNESYDQNPIKTIFKVVRKFTGFFFPLKKKHRWLVAVYGKQNG